MAEEPQPSTMAEGAEAPDALPANEEDRKAAKAMSALDTRAEEPAQPKKEADMQALTEAIKNLSAGSEASKTKKEKVKKEEEKKPLIKVEAGDVALLAEQLDMSKTKATELLRAHEADAVKAMTAWVTTSV